MKAIRNINPIKMSVIVLMIIGFTSCTKEKVDPIVNLEMQMEKTDQFEYVEVDFNNLYLYGVDESNDTFKSNLQSRFENGKSGMILNQNRTLNITQQNHFAMKVVALKADMSLYVHINKTGTNQKVYESINADRIMLANPVLLEPNKSYNVRLVMNTETAIKLTPNNTLAIDWSEVKAIITEK